MLDINFIRENRELVKQGMSAKGEKDHSIVDQVIEEDEKGRSVVTSIDRLRVESNKKSKQIGELMARGKREEAQALIAETGESKDQLKKLEENKEALQARRESLLYQIPNIPDPSVPVGKTPEENEVFKEWGERLDETWRKPHWELAEQRSEERRVGRERRAQSARSEQRKNGAHS